MCEERVAEVQCQLIAFQLSMAMFNEMKWIEISDFVITNTDVLVSKNPFIMEIQFFTMGIVLRFGSNFGRSGAGDGQKR